MHPIPLAHLDTAGLEKLSKDGGLALDGVEMTAIQKHFQTLGRAPTRMELRRSRRRGASTASTRR